MFKITQIYRLTTISNLVWLGFILTTCPLLLAIFFTVYSVGEITELGRVTVYNVFRITQQSSILNEKLSVLERSIKTYFVLEDPEYLAAYRLQHEEFIVRLNELAEMTEDDTIRHLKNKLESVESALYDKMVSTDVPISDLRPSVEEFENLNEIFSKLMRAINAHVRIDADRLNDESDLIIKRVLLLTGCLLAGSFVLVLIFVYLIVRPIRHLDLAIRSLGSGSYDHSIQVSGPSDLESLGKRLDWLRKRLKNLEESKQQFFRDVSHELKTPLSTIREGVELLDEDVVGNLNVEQRDIVEIILKSSHRLETLIEDILSFNRVQTSEDRNQREKINMKDLVLKVAEEHQINLKANKLTLDMQLDEVEIYGNTYSIGIILNNLLSNAIKFSPENSSIRILLNQFKDQIRLEVEDNGPGIDRSDRQKIFEKFYRGDSSKIIGVKGSGLGLSIASECIAAHHGQIEATEPRFGKGGALLRVTLPLDFRR